MKLNSKQLRSMTSDDERLAYAKQLPRNEIYIILDDILDTYNIGAIFRLADAVSAKKVYLTAGCETPPNHRILKASVHTADWVEWEYLPTAVEAIQKLRSEVPNVQVVAIELDERSTPYDQFDYQYPVALVLGHETTGITPATLEYVDGIVELPMYGVNISLNVMVSLAIVLYKVLERSKL